MSWKAFLRVDFRFGDRHETPGQRIKPYRFSAACVGLGRDHEGSGLTGPTKSSDIRREGFCYSPERTIRHR